jgi:cytochrome c-type biogenesis protein CcmH
VTTAFVLLAGLMLLAALAFVLLPLLRHGRGAAAPAAAARRRALDDALAAGVITAEEHLAKLAALEQQDAANANAATTAPPRSRSAFHAALLTLLLLPAAAIGLYSHLGNVRALDSAVMDAGRAMNGSPGPDMNQAVQGLADKLAKNPDDVEGWVLLGRAYKSMERFADARDALKNAYDRAPNEVEIQVDYAEALALAGETRRIDGRARELLEGALKTDPNHQRALWLLGIADYQAQNYASAVARWELLRGMLPPEAPVRESLDRQIADARERGGLGAAPDAPARTAGAEPANGAAPAAGTTAANAAAAADPAASSDVRLTVTVSLDPKLRDKAPAGASVFVFARAASGPPMPLAVQRLTVADLPAKVELTEAMGMLPTMKLSQFPEVVVGARISASGNAKAQSGDLQTLSAPLDVNSKAPIALVIDQVVP